MCRKARPPPTHRRGNPQQYRLERRVHRAPNATIHLATHRNGSTAWLKLPFAKKDSEAIAREASIANTIGSPLLVRDDGTTRDGLPTSSSSRRRGSHSKRCVRGPLPVSACRSRA